MSGGGRRRGVGYTLHSGQSNVDCASWLLNRRVGQEEKNDRGREGGRGVGNKCVL